MPLPDASPTPDAHHMTPGQRRRRPRISTPRLPAEEVTVPPSQFLCPISLELMQDPVTLSSGQTFDRRSIERWLHDGHRTCPVTRMPIDPDHEAPIPNQVLRRVINDWCHQHAFTFTAAMPSPPPPKPRSHHITYLLDTVFASLPCNNSNAITYGSSADSSAAIALISALQMLSAAAAAQPRLRRRIANSGAICRLAHLLSSSLICAEPAPIALLRETLRLLSCLSDDVPGHSYLWEPESADQAVALAALVASPLPSTSAYEREAWLHAAVVLSRTKVADKDTRKQIAETKGMASGLAAILAELEKRREVAEEEGSGYEEWERRQYWKGTEAALRLMAELVTGEERRGVKEAVDQGAVGRIRGVMERWCREGDGGSVAAEWAMMALEGMCRGGEARRATAEEAEGGQKLLKLVMEAIGGGGGGGRRLRKAAVRALSAWLVSAPKLPSVSRALLKFAAAELGALPKVLAVAQECVGPTSRTRSSALSLAKSLSAFAPSFYLC